MQHTVEWSFGTENRYQKVAFSGNGDPSAVPLSPFRG